MLQDAFIELRCKNMKKKCFCQILLQKKISIFRHVNFTKVKNFSKVLIVKTFRIRFSQRKI
jgi:hypothetical protein